MALNRKGLLFRMSLLLIPCLVLAMGAWRPVDFLQELQGRYDRYAEKYQSVKINMMLNQPCFAPGDTAFFCAWYLNEELMPIKGDHIITLDLMGGDGKTYQRIHFKVQNGKGFNQMVLRKDLPPADYNLVAYSDWMKNFGDAWYYQKRVKVVSKKQINPAKKDEPILFYPEGGRLIESIANHIAVRGPQGTALIIRDQAQIEVARVTLDSTGMGTFVFTPRDGQTYSTEQPGGKRWPLPQALKDGIAVHMEMKEQCELLLSIPSNSRFATGEIYAIITSRGKILRKQRASISADQPGRIQIPKHDRSDALHQLFVFDADGNNLAQRVFIPDYGIQHAHLKIQLPAEVKQRETIPFAIDVMDGLGNYIESDLRVSVYQKRLFGDPSPRSDFYLTDLPEVALRAEKFGTRHQASLNDFLITQKWERINWDRILKDKAPELRFAFQSQPALKGEVRSKTTGKPAPDSTVVVSYLQKNNIGLETFTKDGKFELPFVFDFWGDDMIFCTLQYRSKNMDDNYEISIVRDSLSLGTTWASLEGSENSAYADYALSKSLVSKSYSFFGSNQQRAGRQDQTANSIIEEEFLGTDFGVNVADYVVFPKMEDLLREVVPFVQSRQRGNQSSVRMSFRLETSTRVFTDDPLYVIDGTMTRNTSVFLDLKPENLISIKIINNPNKLAQLSRLGENGVIFVQTKKGDFSNSLIKQNLFSVIGLSHTNESFKVNLLRPAPTRIPDLRSTLYWNPLLETDGTGHADMNFFASDDIGTMSVQIQGLTKDGRPFSDTQELKVVFNAIQK